MLIHILMPTAELAAELVTEPVLASDWLPFSVPF
jgi:hypothetical protein